MKRILAGAAIVAVAAIGLPLMASTAATAGGNSSNAKACQKNGWTTKYDANGQPFANEQACTSYGANGGVFGTPTTTTTAPACTGTPTTRLTPSGGVKDAGTLTVDASGSTDPCG